MPYITSVHEALPFIDGEPTPEQRAAAELLVSQERANVPDDPHHALLRPAYEPNLTPLIRAEVERIAAQQKSGTKKPLSAIDLSRYEAQEDLADDASESDLRQALARAYTSQEYLRGRRTHLALLDSYGKNAWLIGNWQVESDLRALEGELAQAHRDIESITTQRQRAQADVAAEINGLEETWRTGVGRVLETEAAAEGVRLQILETRKRLAEETS